MLLTFVFVSLVVTFLHLFHLQTCRFDTLKLLLAARFRAAC